MSWFRQARKFKTKTLRAGTVLYHGTNSPEDFSVPDGPAWFSTDQNVAGQFKEWNRWEADQLANPRILSFQITTPPRLVVFESQQDMVDFSEEHNGAEVTDPHELADIVQSSGYDGWIIPDNYQPGDDIMLSRPEDFVQVIS